MQSLNTFLVANDLVGTWTRFSFFCVMMIMCDDNCIDKNHFVIKHLVFCQLSSMRLTSILLLLSREYYLLNCYNWHLVLDALYVSVDLATAVELTLPQAGQRCSIY